MTPTSRKLLSTLPLLLLAAAGLTPARAFTIQLNGNAPYLCAAVHNNDTANGTAVIASSCSGSPNQQWAMVNDQFQGISTNGVATCLDLKSSFAAGALVVLNACNGSATQLWQFNASGNIFAWHYVAGGIILTLCIDSSGGPTVGGYKQLVANKCGASASQKWLLQGVEFMLTSNAPYQCMSVEGDNITSGTYVIASSCNDGPSQRWSFQNGNLLGPGTQNGGSMCFTSGTGAGSVTLSTCNSSSTGSWIAGNPTGFGYVGIASSDSCVDAAGPPAPGGGTYLVVDTCASSQTQNWILQ